jgi:hypothetical protein
MYDGLQRKETRTSESEPSENNIKSAQYVN